MAEILVSAGYAPKSALNLIKYPTCKSIRSQSPNGQLPIVVDDGKRRQNYKLAAFKATVIMPVYPGQSHMEFAGSQAFDFYYSDSSIAKNPAVDKLSIPAPSAWPMPRFIDVKYPAQVTP